MAVTSSVYLFRLRLLKALHHIYRAIGSKTVPFTGNILLHFDSHPDLLAPKVDANDIYNTGALFDAISIESWIMPALLAGHIDTVVWMKKSWSVQIDDGCHTFVVGRHKESGDIKCTCHSDYFAGELLSCHEEELEFGRSVKLHVMTVQSSDSLDGVATRLREILHRGNIILDVDLDYFSTANPFLAMYTGQQLLALSKLYHLEVYDDIAMTMRKRKEQLDWLEMALKLAVETEGSHTLNENTEETSEKMVAVRRLVSELMAAGPVDVDLLHEHGCTFDTTGLPHHVSSSDEIDDYVKEFTELLSLLKLNPKLITIARSSDDDYCPQDQVNVIEEKVLASLHHLYGSVDVMKHYLE